MTHFTLEVQSWAPQKKSVGSVDANPKLVTPHLSNWGDAGVFTGGKDHIYNAGKRRHTCRQLRINNFQWMQVGWLILYLFFSGLNYVKVSTRYPWKSTTILKRVPLWCLESLLYLTPVGSDPWSNWSIAVSFGNGADGESLRTATKWASKVLGDRDTYGCFQK